MSVAYRLICDQALPDSLVIEFNGLAELTEQVNDLLLSNDLKLIDDYVIDDFSHLAALADELHVSFTDENKVNEQWFDASEGFYWLEKLQQAIEEDSKLSSRSDLVADVATLKQSLQQVMKQGCQWRLQVNLDA